MKDYIYIKGQKYYYHGTYDEYIDAYNEARKWRNKIGARWFILKLDRGYWFPETIYRLYMNKRI